MIAVVLLVGLLSIVVAFAVIATSVENDYDQTTPPATLSASSTAGES